MPPYMHLHSVNLASLSADWLEAKESSMRAGSPPPTLPNKGSHRLRSLVLLELGTLQAVRIQARVNSGTSPPPGSHGDLPLIK